MRQSVPKVFLAWGGDMVAGGRGLVEAVLMAGLGLAASVLVPPGPGQAETAAGCRQDVVPVALGNGRPADQRIVLELCGPSPLDGGGGGGAQSSQPVVHVLISGATYGPSTWDLPYQPERYSYVRAMNEAGIATLNVTRLGMGDSSHPDSSEVNAPSQIFIYQQLIDALRGGRFGV